MLHNQRTTSAGIVACAFAGSALLTVWACVTDGHSEPKAVTTQLPAAMAYVSQSDADRAVPGHVAQEDIEVGKWTVEQLRLAGERLFVAQFKFRDGIGRPGATGNPNPTRRPLGSGAPFVRTAGPDATSCFSCHNLPSIGGAGDVATNVFLGLGARHPLFFSTDPNFSSERGTPELNGSAAIEMLAREMTADLHTLRAQAVAQARASGQRVRVELQSKGISFGFMTVEPNGVVQLNEVEGVDRDLVIRPWGQKGVVTSLRTFTVNAANLHHGMQARERFGMHLTGTVDFDRDGIADELTEGDITALVAFQASLNVPGQVLPRDADQRQAIARGEQLFRESRCASCHIPELPLDNPIYEEPGPYNLEGTLRNHEVARVLAIDLTADIQAPRLRRESDGRVLVRAFTDLKRHRIADHERPHFGNEVVVEGLTSTDEFITHRLWAVGNTAPYGHKGDLTTIREAIHHHGGEARGARLQFEAMPPADQDAIIVFLRSLQALPPGAEPVVFEPDMVALPYRHPSLPK